MKYQKFLIIVMPVLLIIGVIIGYLSIINKEADSIKFKKEYENLNSKYFEVTIDSDNPIKYSSYDEIFDILNNKTGIIFLGYPQDNNSRFAINTLLNVIKDNKIDTTIYYLDIHQDMDYYIVEDGKLVYEKDSANKDRKGNKNYFNLLDLLKEYLNNYIIYVNDEKYDANEKRIYLPTMIFIKDGDIVSLYHSSEQKYEDLYSIYEDNILDMYSSSCDIKSEEPC